jgi:chemotaxis protein methyltransferase CheR
MIAESKLASLSIPDLTAREFDQIRRLAYDHFGLELRLGKEQLVSARLSKIVRALNLKSYQQYCDFLLADKSGEALTAMIDALTTNHTSFFREQEHFEFLKNKILPTLRHRARLAIWSAACSSGEEPYSIAFCLMQTLSHPNWREPAFWPRIFQLEFSALQRKANIQPNDLTTFYFSRSGTMSAKPDLLMLRSA